MAALFQCGWPGPLRRIVRKETGLRAIAWPSRLSHSTPGSCAGGTVRRLRLPPEAYALALRSDDRTIRPFAPARTSQIAADLSETEICHQLTQRTVLLAKLDRAVSNPNVTTSDSVMRGERYSFRRCINENFNFGEPVYYVRDRFGSTRS